MPEERLYFAYGSNLHPIRLTERVGEVEVVSTASLPSYELRFDKEGSDGSGKCTIRAVDDQAAEVIGAVYRLTTDQLSRLDEFEGVGAGYRRVSIEVVSPTERLTTVTYESMSEYTNASLVPYEWYRDLVLEGARFHGFPEEYLEMLRRQPVMDDPDIARAKANETLLEKVRKARR